MNLKNAIAVDQDDAVFLRDPRRQSPPPPPSLGLPELSTAKWSPMNQLATLQPSPPE